MGPCPRSSSAVLACLEQLTTRNRAWAAEAFLQGF